MDENNVPVDEEKVAETFDMKSKYIFNHPTRVMAWYFLALVLLPGLIFGYANASVGGILILMCLGVFRTFTIIREMQYHAVFAPEKARNYLRIDNLSMLAGLVIYYGIEFYFNLGTNSQTINMLETIPVIGCLIPSFMRIDELNKAAQSYIIEEQTDESLREYIKELQKIDKLQVKDAKRFPADVDTFYIKAVLEGGTQLIIEKEDDEIEVWLFKEGIFGKSLVPVTFAVNSILGTAQSREQCLAFPSREAVLSYLQNNIEIIRQLIQEKKIGNIARSWKSGISNVAPDDEN